MKTKVNVILLDSEKQKATVVIQFLEDTASN